MLSLHTLKLVPFVERTEARKIATPRSAEIREGLVILECRKAFENTELSPLNGKLCGGPIDLGVSA